MLLRKLPIIYILSSVFIYAHSTPTIIGPIFFLFTLALFGAAIIIRISIKNDIADIMVFLTILLVMFGFKALKPFLNTYNPYERVYHNFQVPFYHGKYKYNRTLLKDMTILDIEQIHKYNVDKYEDTITLLDDNNSVYFLKNSNISQTIKVTELQNIDRFVYDYKLYLFSGKKFIAFRQRDNGFIYNHDDTIEKINNIVNGDPIPKNKNYQEFHNRKNIIENKQPIVLLDNNSSSIYFYNQNQVINTVKLPYLPKAILYHKAKDELYVIYPNQKGLHILSNTQTQYYIKLQNIVKQMLQTALVPKDKYKIAKIDKTQYDPLRKYIMSFGYINFDYQVQEKEGRYNIIVTDSYDSNLHITFTIFKNRILKIDNITYQKRATNKEKWDKMIENLNPSKAK